MLLQNALRSSASWWKAPASALRLADVSINTVTKLLVDIGTACAQYQDNALRNLPCKRAQVDEIWAFCYAKAKNVETAKAAPENAGDIWTWTGLRSAPKRSSSCPGSSAVAMRATHRSLSRT
jgi:hypothetical protein